MTLSPDQRRAALEAFCDYFGLDETEVISPPKEWNAWLRSWEKATEAAYEQAADMCKQQGDETLCSWCNDTSKLEDKFRAISKGEPT